jgi:hypothetical protein
MATSKQIQFRLRLAKKTLTKVTKDLTATKARVKKLEAQLKKAKAAEQAKKARKKKPAARKRPAKRKKATRKKK